MDISFIDTSTMKVKLKNRPSRLHQIHHNRRLIQYPYSHDMIFLHFVSAVDLFSNRFRINLNKSVRYHVWLMSNCGDEWLSVPSLFSNRQSYVAQTVDRGEWCFIENRLIVVRVNFKVKNFKLQNGVWESGNLSFLPE